jgi:5-methylcytosine-specific restriction endonuclease McrA
VIPLDRGGSNGPENIVIACPECNHSKHNKLPHEWNGSGGRLL